MRSSQTLEGFAGRLDALGLHFVHGLEELVASLLVHGLRCGDGQLVVVRAGGFLLTNDVVGAGCAAGAAGAVGLGHEILLKLMRFPALRSEERRVGEGWSAGPSPHADSLSCGQARPLRASPADLMLLACISCMDLRNSLRACSYMDFDAAMASLLLFALVASC